MSPRRRRPQQSLLDWESHRPVKQVCIPYYLHKASLNTSMVTASLFALRPQSRLPFPFPDFVEGSSRPVNNRRRPQLREQVHLPGAPASAAVDSNNNSRNLNGSPYSTNDFVQMLEEQNIRLAAPGKADLNIRQVNSRAGFVSSSEPPSPTASPPREGPVDDDLPPSSPPRSSPSPGPHSPLAPSYAPPVPRPMFIQGSPVTFGQERGSTTRRTGSACPPLPTPPVRPPSCSLRNASLEHTSAGPSQQPAQPSAPFRFGVRSPVSPSSSEGSADPSSPSPTPAPIRALLSSRRSLQGSGPNTQAVPRLRPARFSPPTRRPLRREATVFLEPPVSAPEPVAGPSRPRAQEQAERRPLRREGAVFLQPPVSAPEPIVLRPQPQTTRRTLQREATVSLEPSANRLGREQAGPSTRRPQAALPTPGQAGTSRVRLQAQAAPSTLPAQPQAGPSRVPSAGPAMRMRDPTDGRFFLPLPPAEVGPSTPNRKASAPRRQKPLPSRAGLSRSGSVIRQLRQETTLAAHARDRILEVAESLGTLPPVMQGTSSQASSIPRPLDNEVNTTANSDEAEPISLSLDISSDSGEANVEEGGDGGDGNDAQAPSDDADRDGEDTTDDTGNAGRVDKGKGRAADDGDDDAGDFWAVNGGFSQRSRRTIIEVDPSNLEDTVDAMLKVLEERARSRPTVAMPDMDDPPRHRGCSREELQRMLASAVSQAEKMKMIKLMRQQMYYDIEYLRAQAEYIHTLELVMHSKRISLEELLQMLEKALKAKRAAQRHSHGDGGDVDGGDDSGAGTSGGDGASSCGSDDSRAGNGPADQGSDEGRERDAVKQAVPPVAVRRQATRRIARPMKKLPTTRSAGPSSQAIPAWDAAAVRASSSSGLGSSPSPVFPLVSVQRRPLRSDPVTPPRRLSAAMKEKARQWLAGLPIDLPSPPSNSPDSSARRAPPIEPSPVGTARVRLTGAFASNSSHELPMLANGPSSTSAARAGVSISQRVPSVQRPQADESATTEKRIVVPARRYIVPQ
ncbi:hypothetical protein C8Q72DRAFT_6701 [Fomitopsis betulina]|nr:hypothetical protein C8Q72DRAFT_6701 [Fomitopsis betulina]